MDGTISRAEFLGVAGAALALTAISTVPGCASSSGENDSDADTPSSAYEGEGAMSKKVLVGYATRTGSTVGVAEAIGKRLAKRGYAVDVRPMKEHPGVSGYDAVVLGSAVNGGAWLPEAVSFVKANREALGRTPVSLFCVHIMNMGDEPKHVARRNAYLNTLREVVTPAQEAFFAGKGPTAEDTSLIARWAFKAFGGGGEGDCRDWDAIDAWADGLAI